MSSQLKCLDGAKVYHQWKHHVISSRPPQAPPCSRSRYALRVEANKKVKKTQQVVLLETNPKLGKEGEVVTVAAGYWRNYLGPMGKAKPATQAILNKIEAAAKIEQQKKEEVKTKAQALATALQTIGRFVIKKKSGERDQIFGSVTTQEIADAIYQQTSQQLDKSKFTIPEIKALGTYDVQVKLHPEVTGTFKVVVQREKIDPQKRK